MAPYQFSSNNPADILPWGCFSEFNLRWHGPFWFLQDSIYWANNNFLSDDFTPVKAPEYDTEECKGIQFLFGPTLLNY